MANDYDVIVIGGGGAGMCAAIEAHDAGARVLLIEAAKQLGGSIALPRRRVPRAPRSG
jgi:fumarate reductase flavoprotein subunit